MIRLWGHLVTGKSTSQTSATLSGGGLLQFFEGAEFGLEAKEVDGEDLND